MKITTVSAASELLTGTLLAVSIIGGLSPHDASDPAPDWQQRFVTAYASAHPWEDWAETWAHYLHVMDGTETARAFGAQTANAVPCTPWCSTTWAPSLA